MVKWLIRAFLGVIVLTISVAIGGYFVLKRDDIPYETLATRYESTASRYADLPGGVRVHYRDEGNPNGRALLLIHGFAASLHTWEAWVALLGDEYRIVSLDLPGHGLTRAPAGYLPSVRNYADIVSAFVRAQRLEQVSVAGSSMGGHVAWEYALAHPEQIDALILVDSAGAPESVATATSAETPLIFKLLANPTARSVLRDLDTSRLTRQGLQAAFPSRPEQVDATMVARYTELARAPGHREVLMALVTGAPSVATPERLAALAMPVLILHGARDVVVPADRARAFESAIPHAELVLFDGVGHVPQEEAPDASAAAVRAFLSGVAARQPN